MDLGDADELPCKWKSLNFLPGLKTFGTFVIFDKIDLKNNVLPGSRKVYKV